MLDEQHRRLARDLLHQRDEIVDLAVGQALGRLVEDEQPRLQRQPHGDLQQPLMAVGEMSACWPARSARPVRSSASSMARSQGAGAAPVPILVERALRGERDIVVGGEVGEDAGDLEGVGDAEPNAPVRGQVGDVLPSKAIVPDDGASGRRSG